MTGSGGSTVSEKYRVTDAIVGMFSFFTMLPINIEMKHIDAMNRRFCLVPIIGLFYALLAAGLFALIEYLTGSTTVSAALTLFLTGMMNRFLHFDGTIDVGDGLTVAGKREDHIRALKDTLIGAGGMVTGAMVILTLFAEYSSMSVATFVFVGAAGELFARNAQVSVAAFGTPGNGMAGDSVRYTSYKGLAVSTVLTVLIALAYWFGMSYIVLGEPVYTHFIVLFAGIIASVAWGFIMSRIAEKNFGMVNGDVLGATNETSRIIVIFVMLSMIHLMGL